jgi:hypothetical protein
VEDEKMSQPRPSFQPPPEEEAIPLEPGVARTRSDYIKSNLDKMIKLKQEGKTKEEIQEMFERFIVDYPSLFKMVMSPNYNEGSLKTMMAMLERMGSGELTQHQASVIVGQRLHDVYIKPKVDEIERNAM